MKLKSFKQLKVFLHNNFYICPRCGAYTDKLHNILDENICGNCYKTHIFIYNNIINHCRG